MKTLLKFKKYSLIFQRGFHWVLNSQLWFWTDEWQAGEREVDEDIKAGRVESFDTIDEFMSSLEQAAIEDFLKFDDAP
jgi:hypothetical protein